MAIPLPTHSYYSQSPLIGLFITRWTVRIGYQNWLTCLNDSEGLYGLCVLDIFTARNLRLGFPSISELVRIWLNWIL